MSALADGIEKAPTWQGGGTSKTSDCNAFSLPAEPVAPAVATPEQARAWEANAPLTAPEYWLGRSAGYQQGYADGQEDLLRWQEAQFIGRPLPLHADIELTAEQVHRVGGGGRG